MASFAIQPKGGFQMATTTDRLNSLLRGEIAATETYQQALDKLGETKGASELRRIHHEHVKAASTLRQHVHHHGGQPDKGSGAWGAFAKAVEGTAKILGNDAALKALKEGEEHGIKEYEDALQDKALPNDCQSLIRTELLPQTREHLPVLDRLMAGLVDRISPPEAHRRLESDPSAMLVCAYDSQEKFRENHLAGAISLDEFKSRADAIPKDRDIIFYCA
jgi:uncharacterized protein (TIGR02284 family)